MTILRKFEENELKDKNQFLIFSLSETKLT
jgi:hypothetical protein